MSPSGKLLNSTNSTQNAKEIPEDFSLLFELLFVVGVVLIGGIAMIIMTQEEKKKDSCQQRVAVTQRLRARTRHM
ncbi:hypothetical protein EAE99_000456 [Botrytis elliptica]|nr:hypothetical protein EAE99_000456 [Botrytis elliptica]